MENVTFDYKFYRIPKRFFKEDMFRDMTNAAKVLYGILLDRKCLSDSNGDALKRQNEIIFEAEKERNSLENKRDSLKGLTRLTKKSELQNEIDRANERIEILKIGLSGIVKRDGWRNVQEFYKSYHVAKTAYADYQSQATEWEKTYGKGADTKQQSFHERMQNYQNETSAQQKVQIVFGKDEGAR